MGLFEHWPYVNFHDLNLDWIIKEFPKVYASRDEAQASAEASAESEAASQLSADAALASKEAARQSELNAAQSEENAADSEANAKNYADHIADPVAGLVTEWLEDNITPTTPAVDASLTVSGAAADAKVTGDELTDLKSAVRDGIITLTETLSNANWEVGDINASGQNINRSTMARLKTDFAFYGENCVLKNVNGGVYVYVCQYEDQACTQYVGEIGTLNYQGVTEISLPNNYWYRLKATFINTTSLTPADIENILAAFTIYQSTQISENRNEISTLYELVSNNASDIEDLSDRYYLEYGINRNPNNDTNGYLKSDGTIAVASDWKTTDLCYVNDLEAVCASANGVGYTTRIVTVFNFLCTYDNNKNFIEQVYTTGQPTYTVENNVAYIRFCYHSNTVENIMVESGTTILPYFVEYVEPQLKLKQQYYDSGIKWTNKKWVAFGDSLTENNTRTTAHYHDYIASQTGINVVNMGVSGTGYKRSDDENKAFYQRISNVPTDTDVITIFGSFNDLGSGAPIGTAEDTGTSTIGGCINTTLDNLFAVIPLANVGLVTPTPWTNQNPLNEPNNASQYVDLIIAICKRRSIPCLDLFHNSLLRPWDSNFRTLAYSRDDGNGTHPDENGHKLIAPRFMAFLQSLLL